MNTQRDAAKTLQKEIANAGALSCGDQVPSLKEDVNDYQASVDPLFLMNCPTNDALFELAQVITTKSQVVTTQEQSMMS